MSAATENLPFEGMPGAAGNGPPSAPPPAPVDLLDHPPVRGALHADIERKRAEVNRALDTRRAAADLADNHDPTLLRELLGALHAVHSACQLVEGQCFIEASAYLAVGLNLRDVIGRLHRVADLVSDVTP